MRADTFGHSGGHSLQVIDSTRGHSEADTFDIECPQNSLLRRVSHFYRVFCEDGHYCPDTPLNCPDGHSPPFRGVSSGWTNGATIASYAGGGDPMKGWTS